MKKKWFRTYLLRGLGMVSICICMTACSAADEGSGNENPVTSEVVEQTEVEETEEVQQPEAEAEGEVEPTEDVEEPTEETTPEEPQVEMVDFETWAKQEGNDEVCLVVWNEELGVQEIMPTLSEAKKAYEVQEGDRFAIPYRENIHFMGIRDESTWMWPTDKDYYELSLAKGEKFIVDIRYKDESGETIILTYTFK